MKSIIIYHSQTGNTYKIARAIQSGITHSLGQCRIVSLKKVKPKDLTQYDLIGFGSPVWVCLPTPDMLAFMDGLPKLEGRYGFFFCTHGAKPGQVFKEAVKALERKKLTVVGWANWYGSVFVQFLPKPYYTDGHPDDIDLNEAEAFGKEMAERSQAVANGVTHLIPKLPEGKEYEERYGKALSISAMPEEWREPRTRELRINPDKCTSCMLCHDNCPSDNIDFSVSPPVFKSIECQRCWFCEQICPEGAIEYDFEDIVRATEKYSRPNLEKEVDTAEAKGYFRRLVPKEKVGWDTPWYKVSDHPRLVIFEGPDDIEDNE